MPVCEQYECPENVRPSRSWARPWCRPTDVRRKRPCGHTCARTVMAFVAPVFTSRSPVHCITHVFAWNGCTTTNMKKKSTEKRSLQHRGYGSCAAGTVRFFTSVFFINFFRHPRENGRDRRYGLLRRRRRDYRSRRHGVTKKKNRSTSNVNSIFRQHFPVLVYTPPCVYGPDTDANHRRRVLFICCYFVFRRRGGRPEPNAPFDGPRS